MLHVICTHVAAHEETGSFMANYLLSATRYGWTIVNLLTSKPRMAVMLNSFTLVWSGCLCRACCRPINASRNLHNTGYTHTSPDHCRPDHQLRRTECLLGQHWSVLYIPVWSDIAVVLASLHCRPSCHNNNELMQRKQGWGRLGYADYVAACERPKAAIRLQSEDRVKDHVSFATTVVNELHQMQP